MDYKKIIASHLAGALDVDQDLMEKLIEVPPKPEMGDFAFPCFQLAKTLNKAPNKIAEELKSRLSIEEIEDIQVLGPYLNFFLKKDIFIRDVTEQVFKEGERYGSGFTGQGKNVLVEYSSPNIAKPFHVGHLSTTVIGSSLAKIFAFEGYNVTRINHLGDWGTQFGKLIAAYERWVDVAALEKKPIDELLRIYVKFHEEAEKDPALEDKAREHFKNLEDGKEYEVGLWRQFRELSLLEFKAVYEKLNVEFDSYAGESFYSDKMDRIIGVLEEKNLITESNNAKVVMLEEYNMPPIMIKKGDGATIYATRDLAAALYRKETYDFFKNIYVVGTPQSLHFKQVFKTLELAGYPWAKDCVHVGFGLVKFPDKKLSTRKGDVVLLEDLLDQAVETSRSLIDEKNPELEHKDEVAKKVGIGAVIFTYLRNYREKDIVFDWKEMLSFEGETGPYVQYTYARARSILRKNEAEGLETNLSLHAQEEFELAKTLSVFHDAVVTAVEKYEPSVITRYVLELAKDFNKFYNNCPIRTAEADVRKARLALVKATCVGLHNALALLGIETVERM